MGYNIEVKFGGFRKVVVDYVVADTLVGVIVDGIAGDCG